jgi:hypothetical protein
MYPRCLSILLCGALLMLAGCDKDNNPPRKITWTPVSDSQNAPRQGRLLSLDPLRIDPMIKVQFNESLLESSIPENAITLEQAGEPIGGAFAYSLAVNTVSFEPTQPLFFLREYNAKLASGISDLKGNRIKEEFEWSFRVRDGSFGRDGSPLETRSDGDAITPQVSIGQGGHGFIIWQQAETHRFDANGDGDTSDDDDSVVTRAYIKARRFQSVSAPAAPVANVDNLPSALDSGDAVTPQIAVDPSGNAVAVWSKFNGTNWEIRANRYVAETLGWGTAPVEPSTTPGPPAPAIISSGGDDATVPQIAVDSDGNAIAVWIQSDRIHANRFTVSGGWGTAELIDNDAGTPGTPRIVIDGDDATVVWAQGNFIYAARHTGTWAEPVQLDNGNGTATASPEIAVDGEGNVIAVWSQSDGVRNNIWARRFSSDADTWGTGATLIETDNTGDANTPHIAMNAVGNAIAVWSQYIDADEDSENDPRFRIRASHFTPSGGWGDARLAEKTNDNPNNADDATFHSVAPRIAIDADGNGLLVWVIEATLLVDHDNNTSTPRVELPHTDLAWNRYRAHDNNWEDFFINNTFPKFLELDPIPTQSNPNPSRGRAIGPQIAIMPDFTGLAVWAKAAGLDLPDNPADDNADRFDIQVNTFF